MPGFNSCAIVVDGVDVVFLSNGCNPVSGVVNHGFISKEEQITAILDLKTFPNKDTYELEFKKYLRVKH